MSIPSRTSARRPLMRVNEQQPRDDSGEILGAQNFCMRLHNFVVTGSQSTTPTSSGADLPLPGATNHGERPRDPTYQQICFTNASVSGAKPARKSSTTQGEPKRKKRRATRLTSSKPVKSSSDMHADAWNVILAHTRPSFVMQMRKLSKFFYHLTNADAIWRNAREYHFGSDMPACPKFLTERQYADLIDGRGCQNSDCERRETRKTRWIFRVRFCDECLAQKLSTYKFGDAPSPQSLFASLFENPTDREQFGMNLIDLLPTTTLRSGKVHTPRTVSKESGKWSSPLSHVAPVSYLKGDYKRVEQEYEIILREKWEPQRVFEWTKEKYLKATHMAKTASEFDLWELKQWHDKFKTTIFGTVRLERQEFYIHKAGQLWPPISEDVLWAFSAFHNALASPNPPSERAWEILLAKILPYRALAEEVVKYSIVTNPWATPPCASAPEIAWYDRLHEHRTTSRKEFGIWQPEQKFVIDLAEEHFERLVSRVADEDLLLLCLRNVYTAFQNCTNKPNGLRFDGTRGEYRLSLDDARLIIEEVMEKRISKSTLQGIKVLESLKCMGCTRWASGKTYSFQSAFEHMLEKHAKIVGKDLHFHRFLKRFKVPTEYYRGGYVFPWYLIEWTRSLPLLPVHASISANTRWLPNEDSQYIPMREPCVRSMFEGRRAVLQASVGADDFEGNFVHAIKIMLTTRLEIDCVVAVAIKYAVQLQRTERAEEATLADFLACIKAAKQINGGLQFKFRCGACIQRPHVSSHIRCVKHAVEVETLQRHWYEKHRHENIHWVTNFAHLPSDIALTNSMIDHDAKLKEDQDQSVRRETIDIKKNTRKLPNQKAAVLMQKQMVTEVFGQLFI